jgi:glycosyltransferase involved in cell wall biosynthesis
MTRPVLSAVICTYNPRADFLADTLASLRNQRPLAEGETWELLIIDNASDVPLKGSIDLSWHPQARVIREDRLGLTHARHRSFAEAQGEVIVYIDDDNVLAEDYLAQTLKAFQADANLGATGGKAIPRWEIEPSPWFADLGISMACRDLGEKRLEARWTQAQAREYPECAPIGAGMGVRRSAYEHYVKTSAADPVRSQLGRRGADLSSGEDNDMILSLLSQGWSVAYLPELQLEHLIPARRLQEDYLERYAQSSNRTWVQVLSVHGIQPWTPIAPWTLPLRKTRAWLELQAWKRPVNRIRWRGACGILEGRASLVSRVHGS